MGAVMEPSAGLPVYGCEVGGLRGLTRVQLLVLLDVIGATALMFSGMTSVAIALPEMQKEFGVSQAAVTWVVTAALLPVASLVTISGRLGDLSGRRRWFIRGTVCFGIGSALCAGAPGLSLLLAGRALQGIGAAVAVPLALANLTQAMPPARRGWAIGVLASGTTVVTAVSPLLMALIVEVTSWRWLFAANVPVAVVVVLLAVRFVPETRGPPEQALDVWGVASLSAGLTLLVLGADLGAKWGLTQASTVGLLSAGLLVLGVFVAVERTAVTPLIELRLLRGLRTWASMTGLAVMQCASLAVTIFLTLYLRQVLGLGALAAGVLLLPTGFGSPVISPIAGWLADRGFARSVITGGLILGAAALAWLVWGAGRHQGVLLIPALFLFGLAPALVNTPASAVTISSLPGRVRGVAASLTVEARQIGGVLGLAFLNALVTAVEWHTRQSLLRGRYSGFSHQQRQAFDSLLFNGDNSVLLNKVPPGLHDQTVTAANTALTGGLQAALGCAAILLLIGAVLTLIGVRGRRAPSEKSWLDVD
jgi:EmrB/QacA subfamily drug resistance transporter